MAGKKYKYIYGPVSSWRLGRSLGVDAVYTPGSGKACSFDCVYCQAGRTHPLTEKRKVYVSTEDILTEIESLPPLRIDYITFSGNGEPTLARNLGDVIKGIRKVRVERIAILTNSSLIDRESVRKDLALADFVIAKLDAHAGELFAGINKPAPTIKFTKIIDGLKKFRRRYKGRLALRIMFTKKNAPYAREIAGLTAGINPGEIQLNTPLRPCRVKPLSRYELDKLKIFFKGTTCLSVYDRQKRKGVRPLSKIDTLERRRGR